MKHWLMKSEPDVYGIADLERDGRTSWEGVRNYQARNLMREMTVGDLVVFYHSNTDPSGAAGLCKVARAAYPDDTARDPRSPYHDPRATAENPVWDRVDVAFLERFPRVVALRDIRMNPACRGMLLLARGSRLSVQPLTKAHFETLVRMGRLPT